MRPRATSWRSRKRKAVWTEVTARSVSAAVTRITGQTPPMSHSAINNAASDFMRRSRCMTSASPAAASTSREVFSISEVRCGSGSHARRRISRAASARIRSNRYGENSAMPSRMARAGGRSSHAPISADCCGSSSASQSPRRCSAVLLAVICGPLTNRAAKAEEFMPPSVAHPAFGPQACHPRQIAPV